MVHFIVNKHSGSGKGEKVWRTIEEELQKREEEHIVYFTGHERHATELATRICNEIKGEVKLIVLGGDGTINEVVNGITDFSRVQLGIIPVGSGNDFARGLHIKGNKKRILKKILSCKEPLSCDMGKVSWDNGEKSRYYLISAGIGFDAIICKKFLTSPLKKKLNKVHLGKLSYLILVIQTLKEMEKINSQCLYRTEGKNTIVNSYEGLIFVAAMNMQAEGAGIVMAPKASAKDGLLSVCSVDGISKAKALLVLPFMLKGHHTRFECTNILDCNRMEIALDKPMELHTDGECWGEVDRATFECLPGNIKIMWKRKKY